MAATPGLESARRDWEDGRRRFEAMARSPGADVLHRQLEVLTDELRKRVGATFTLAELAGAYRSADAWAAGAIDDHAPSASGARTVAVVLDAAFHGYSRAAVDFTP